MEGEECATTVLPASSRFTPNRAGLSAVSVAVGPNGAHSAGKCRLERQNWHLSQVEGEALPADWNRRDDEGAVLLKTHQHWPLQLFTRQKSGLFQKLRPGSLELSPCHHLVGADDVHHRGTARRLASPPVN